MDYGGSVGDYSRIREDVSMSWLREMFVNPKPVIGMLHLVALPGDPNFESAKGMRFAVDHARTDLANLQNGGVDGVLISNEFSLPYLTSTEPVTGMSMARIIGEIRSDISVPFGVNVLWDGIASLDLAAATGAMFVREVFTGVYASDFGLWNTNVGATARHRARLGISDVKLLFNLVPEAANYLANRNLGDLTRSTIFNALPEGIVVSGLTAGAPTESADLRQVKDNAGSVPVFVNTGVTPASAAAQLAIADGAIVGTSFKFDGEFQNAVDVERVKELMAVVNEVRDGIA
jgi:membrane complex biogenesis BtpA family protein